MNRSAELSGAACTRRSAAAARARTCSSAMPSNGLAALR